jgi:hypothetical protein
MVASDTAALSLLKDGTAAVLFFDCVQSLKVKEADPQGRRTCPMTAPGMSRRDDKCWLCRCLAVKVFGCAGAGDSNSRAKVGNPDKDGEL